MIRMIANTMFTLMLAFYFIGCGTSRFNYDEFVSRVNKYYTPPDGKPFHLDTTGHPPVKGLVSQLDSSSALIPNWPDSVLEEEGVGLEVCKQFDSTVVCGVMVNYPARDAGVLLQDRIIDIDGRSTVGVEPDSVYRLLSGKPGSKAKITLLRASVGRIEITVERKEVLEHPRLDQIYLDSLKIGYVRFRNFHYQTAYLFPFFLKKFRDEKNAGLLIDLRQSKGGLLDECVNTTKLLLEKGKRIGEVRGNGLKADQSFSSNDSKGFSMPCVVLVDSMTGGGAELMAGALKENKRALIFGRRTNGYGKARGFVSSGDTTILLTIGYMFLPSGAPIEKIGIEPTISFADSTGLTGKLFPQTDDELKNILHNHSDPVLCKGVELLSDMKRDK